MLLWLQGISNGISLLVYIQNLHHNRNIFAHSIVWCVPMVVHMCCVMYVHTHKVIAHFGTTVMLILGQGFFPEFNFMLGCAMALCHRWSMYVFSNYALNNLWRMCVQSGQNSCRGFEN
jgi:hypothetical protein